MTREHDIMNSFSLSGKIILKFIRGSLLGVEDTVSKITLGPGVIHQSPSFPSLQIFPLFWFLCLLLITYVFRSSSFIKENLFLVSAPLHFFSQSFLSQPKLLKEFTLTNGASLLILCSSPSSIQLLLQHISETQAKITNDPPIKHFILRNTNSESSFLIAGKNHITRRNDSVTKNSWFQLIKEQNLLIKPYPSLPSIPSKTKCVHHYSLFSKQLTQRVLSVSHLPC